MVFVRVVCRVFAFLLIVGLAGGSALLDGCLVSCHSESSAKNARTGHCHTAPSSAGAHLQEIARCCHDGTSGLADTNDGQSKLIAGSFVAIADITVDGRDRFSRNQFTLAAHIDVFSVIDSRLTPLRL